MRKHHLVWFLSGKVGGAYGPLATKGLPELPRATQSLPGQPEGPDEGALKVRSLWIYLCLPSAYLQLIFTDLGTRPFIVPSAYLP